METNSYYNIVDTGEDSNNFHLGPDDGGVAVVNSGLDVSFLEYPLNYLDNNWQCWVPAVMTHEDLRVALAARMFVRFAKNELITRGYRLPLPVVKESRTNPKHYQLIEN